MEKTVKNKAIDRKNVSHQESMVTVDSLFILKYQQKYKRVSFFIWYQYD